MRGRRPPSLQVARSHLDLGRVIAHQNTRSNGSRLCLFLVEFSAAQAGTGDGQLCANPKKSDPIFHLLRVSKFTTPFLPRLRDTYCFRKSESRPVGAAGAALYDSANVPRPSASSLISLRHPLHRPRQRASVVCAAQTPPRLTDLADGALSAAALRRRPKAG